MAKYRYVYCEFWTDPDVLEFTPEEKNFYLYILTNPHTSQCGIFEISVKQMEFETGYNRDTIQKLINRFEEYDKIKYNFETKEMAIKNWPKYNGTKSPKVQKCIDEELKKIKDILLIEYVYGMDMVCIPLRKEKEERKEEIKEKEKEKEERKEETKNDTVSSAAKNFSDVISVFNNNIHPVTQLEYEKIKDWCNEVECEVVIRAIEEAVYYNKRSMQYINAILNNWLRNNLKTIEGVNAYFRDRADKKGKKDGPGAKGKVDLFNDYEQRSYDYDDLEKKLLGLDNQEKSD